MIALQVPLQSQVLCITKCSYHYSILLYFRYLLLARDRDCLASAKGCCIELDYWISKRQVASVAGQVTGVAEQVTGGMLGKLQWW
jgi:hypothetical protein